MKLSGIFFQNHGEQFQWHKYPKLHNPETWSKLSAKKKGRDKLKAGFYKWTKEAIHAPLTDIQSMIPGGANLRLKKKRKK